MVVHDKADASAASVPWREAAVAHHDRSDDATSDGVIGLYALRILDRGIDPRTLVAEHRSTRYGSHDRRLPRLARRTPVAPARAIGRGTAEHRAAAQEARRVRERRPAHRRRTGWPSRRGFGDGVFGPRPVHSVRLSRRLVTAGLAVLLIVSIGTVTAFAQDRPLQQRYVVQPGDSLADVAARFGVDPEAIIAASAIRNAPELTPAEIIVIPAPGQTPAEAAEMAAGLDGTSPFVVGAHVVEPGETLAGIAAAHGVPVDELTALNGLVEPDVLAVGQRLLIPSAGGGATMPAVREPEPAPETAPSDVGGWTQVVVPGIPSYRQQYSLSCEYAAAYIATSAFGMGIPESSFLANVPPARNPHWGYRGDINGAWGGTDDYGVYAEALVPTLNDHGFAAEVFYAFGDPAPLRSRIDAGLPVLTWLGFWGDTGFTLDDEGTYTVAPGMHVVVVYGYDDDGVHVSNPGRGTYDYYPWETFTAMWRVLDGMSLAVAPF